jgi:hypothetical protein
VPPNSHSFLREYVEMCKGNGANIVNLITRISFVPGVQGTLQFKAVSYIDEPTAQLRQAAYAEKKTDALVGRNDVARPAGAIAAPVQQYVLQAEPGHAQGTAPLVHVPIQQAQQWPVQQVQHPAQQPVQQTTQWPQQQAQQVHQSGPFVAQQPQAAGFAVTAAPTGQPAQNAAPNVETRSPSDQPATGRRRRRTAAEMQAAQQPAQGPNGTQAPFPHPGQAAQPVQTDMSFGIAEGQPAAANPELAGTLDDFFKQG